MPTITVSLNAKEHNMPLGWAGGATSSKPGYSLKLLLEYKVELEEKNHQGETTFLFENYHIL